MVISLNLLLFYTIFSCGKQKKSCGAKSGEQEKCGAIVILLLARNHGSDKAECEGALPWYRNQSPEVHFSDHPQMS
jgi:hypothetical protein